MEYQEKIDKFLAKDGREAHRTKTHIDELPLQLKYGSSTHNPDRKGGMSTGDIVLWCKFLDNNWFRPYGDFSMGQIHDLIAVCSNDNQIVALMELLSATKN